MNSRLLRRFSLAAVALLITTAAGGCTSATRLELRGDPQGPASYELREVLWRASGATDGRVEMVGYGLIPYYNDFYSREWNSRWPQRGYVTFWLHAAPEAQDRYTTRLLGPAIEQLGPGDDEILTGVAQGATVVSDGDKRIIHITDLPMQSRNKPDIKFLLSGQIIATPTNDATFDRQMRRFNEELNMRKPLPK